MTALDASPFANRLRKNARHFRRWAARQRLTAYRLYDRDMPEYPFAVDWYGGRVQVVEYPRRSALRSGEAEARRGEVLRAVETVLEVPAEHVYVKTHTPMPWGRSQYGKRASTGERFVVDEQGLMFWVNLADYLDTGLFLDHRITRARVRDEAKGKSFLNLFAYTGAFTVYAAAGGARSTTTVDLSNTYCAWAEDNLALNGFFGSAHQIVRADVRHWLGRAQEQRLRFDLCVLDPPSFSASKKMSGAFDVQRDHPKLMRQVLSVMSPGGVLYFSTNFQGFEMRADLSGHAVEEITDATTPDDFRTRPHRCWRIEVAAALSPTVRMDR